MKIGAPFFGFLLLIHVGTMQAQRGTVAEDIAAQLRGTKTSEITQGGIPPEYRDEVIAVLRSQAEQNRGSAASVLLRLGDSETVQKQVQIFVENNGADWFNRRNLLFSFSPAVVEAMAPLMFRDDEYRYFKAQHPEFEGAWGVSYESPVIIRHLLRKIPEVPEPVARWADSIPSNPSPELRNTMRQWWEQNREHFESRDFDRLRPLETADASIETVVGEPQAPPFELRGSIEEEESNESPVPDESEQVEPKSNQWWPWIVGGIAILATLIIVARKTKLSS